MRRPLPAAPLVLLLIALLASPLGAGPQEPPPRTARLASARPDEPTTLVFPTFLHTWGMQRARPVHLRLFLGARTRFDDPQGLAAVVLDTWDDPAEKSDDDEVTVYGVNSGRGQIIYNSSMFTLGVYGGRGRGEGQFLAPHGIDADPAGNVVVADTGNDRVAVLYNDGRLMSARRQLTAVAPGDSLSRPYDVVLTPDEGVWVSDTGNRRLVLFGLDGEVRRVLPVGDVLGEPGALALSHREARWSYYRDHALFVASRDGRSLVRMTEEGTQTARVTPATVGQRTMELRYLDVDFYGNVWATDGFTHRLHKFDRNLDLLESFGSRGRGDSQFQSPRGIALWERFGQLFVAEEEGAQYYWIGADARDMQAVQLGDRIALSYRLTESSYLTVRVRYEGGGLEELTRRRFRASGAREDSLDLESDRPLSWIEVVVEPTYSSYTYREKVFNLRFTGGESR